MNRTQPKVLVTTVNAWRDNTGINTLLNFFEGWDTARLAQVYTRDVLPNTHVCAQFFRISEKALIASLKHAAAKTGEQVQNTPEEQEQGNALYQKKHSVLMSFARELVWLCGKWRSKELDAFVEDFGADVLFFPTYASPYMNRLQCYLAKKTGKPFVLYASDDNYSYRSVNKDPLSLLMRAWTRHFQKKLFRGAAKVLVISPKQKREYDKQFSIESAVLTKGIDFTGLQFEPQPVHAPIRMLYTGKLIIGRWRSLAAIAAAMENINREKTRLQLDIYTTDTLTEQQAALLNRGGCSVKGAVSLEKAQQLQTEADILVFAESLERKYKNKARLSFSTKITDYLKSGKCIFAIGDAGIAPMDYFAQYDCAVTATEYAQIENKLRELLATPAQITDYGKRAFECGRKNHEIGRQRNILREALEGAANGTSA